MPASTLRQRFSRLSTAIKMFVILGLSLFPLGLVAVLASVDAARDGQTERAMLARSLAAQSAQSIASLVARDLLLLRVASAAGSSTVRPAEVCSLIERVRLSQPDLVLDRFALLERDGSPVCASNGFSASAPAPPMVEAGTRVWLDSRRQALGFAVATDRLIAVGALGRKALLTAAAAPGGRDIDVHLQDSDPAGANRIALIDRYEESLLQRTIVARARIGGSNVFAVASLGAIPISAVEIVSVLLPLLMWLAAALLGWLIVDRLLLRPIVRLQQTVLAYNPGGPGLTLPRTFTPATEIRDLGDAFARVTHVVSAHEAELEAAVARQARLVREVHHRVKNNLQVVASLLNLHARGARSVDAAEAFATIQRRVDALSVVQRNHYAEVEGDRGVALRPLLSELTGNLRATAPADAAGTPITLELDAAYVNQDVAVSVAFFVTEVVEHAMLCTPDQPIGVTLRQSPSPTVARLILQSASLKADAPCGSVVDIRQFERITTGLSRQMRAVLERDAALGIFAIDITVQENGVEA